MKITHQIDFRERESEVLLICIGMGLKVDERFSRIVIEETDERWPDVKKLMHQYKYFESCEMVYTDEELANALWLRLIPDWHHGYPMPDDDFGYIPTTYNLTDYCSECSMGKEQNKPFRMVREPKWGRRNILQLNWVFDEFFVTPSVWNDVFKPFGVNKWSVLHHKTGKELETVVQLKIDSIMAGPIVLGDLKYEICPRCKRKKYNTIIECGYSPAMSIIPAGAHAIRSMEIFGSGGVAYRTVYFSQELFSAINKAKIKGAGYYPVKK